MITTSNEKTILNFKLNITDIKKTDENSFVFKLKCNVKIWQNVELKERKGIIPVAQQTI